MTAAVKVFLAATACAQFGDATAVVKEEVLPFARHPAPSPPLSPEEERRSFQVPPGFHVELVAAEPLVHDPVAAQFDREGNLWVVEFTTFNAGMIAALPGLRAGTKPADVPSCRIVKLESSRHDGHFDRRTVWLDGLAEAKGIALVRDGALISDPPHLWLARDLHGAGRFDDQKLVVDGYEAWSDPEESGSLLWGRDHVLHGIDFSYDYRYRAGAAQPIPVPVRGQFGLTQDDLGRLFYSRSMDHLHGDEYPAWYALRNPDAPSVPWVNAVIAPNERVWPSHVTYTNRGYRIGVPGQRMDGVLADGRLVEFTAACSPLIYRGTALPDDCYGNAFVPDAAGNIVCRDRIEDRGGTLTAANVYDGRDFLTSTDSRFRPVNLINAPDGSLVVVDMYRGIIEEYHYITTYLRNQSLERALDGPFFGLGRIWRVVADPQRVGRTAPALDRASAADLAQTLLSRDGWWRDTAQQELVERGDPAAGPALRVVALQAPLPASRIAALWALDGLALDTPELLTRALRDSDTDVRETAVRLHERALAGPDGAAALRQLLAVAADPAPQVRVQLALTLGESPSPEAVAAMADLLVASPNLPDLPSAIETSLGGRESPFLAQLLEHLPSPGRPDIAEMLKLVATAIVHHGDPGECAGLIAEIGDRSDAPAWVREQLLAGLDPLTSPSFRRSVGPSRVLRAASLAPLAASADATIARRAQHLIAGLRSAEDEAARKAAAARPLSPDEQQRYGTGQGIFPLCAGCHQPTGGGLAHVAPSLVDSRWVASYPEVMIRIVLCGKEGTPGFQGPMPPIGANLTNDQIAAVVTYVRNSWGLHEGAVDAATVASVRGVVGARQAPWTDSELERVESTIRHLGKAAFVPPPAK